MILSVPPVDSVDPTPEKIISKSDGTGGGFRGI
jgi:hypothetical protein